MTAPRRAGSGDDAFDELETMFSSNSAQSETQLRPHEFEDVYLGDSKAGSLKREKNPRLSSILGPHHSPTNIGDILRSFHRNDVWANGGGDAEDQGAAARARRRSSTQRKPRVKRTALVITGQFFLEAASECTKVIPPRTVDNRHLIGESSTTSSRISWRRKLQSPLGTFLTGIRNKDPWVQLAGHKDNFLPGMGQSTICKRASEMERAALEALMNDSLKPFVPLYYQEVEMGSNGEVYLEMQDLLAKFEHPCVMDIKMGIRTFLETEVKKKDKRMDLLGKMVKLSPEEPTEEERASGITKLRYMQFRERLSSTCTLGFRVEGIKMASQTPRTDFKTAKTRDECREIIQQFMPNRDKVIFHSIRSGIVKRLHHLKETMRESSFFWSHELIGSSLLFIYDQSGKSGVWMIDFGKTSTVDFKVTHDQQWEYGNREDGYLIGLDNLIDIFGNSSP